MKNILLPTAYSTHSKACFQYALKLAQYFEASITLVHIYEKPSAALASNQATMQRLSDDNQEALEEEAWRRQMDKLEKFAGDAKAKQFADIPIDFIVTNGDVAEELLKIQDSNHFDLVIMGMSRRSLRAKLFGNTAYSLIDTMTCPILLLPPDFKYQGLESIIYGTAFEVGEERIINQLLGWTKAFNAKLNVIHIHKKDRLEYAQNELNLLKHSFQNEINKNVLKFALLEGQIKVVMSEYRDLTQADILAVHRRKQGFWKKLLEGSLTKDLADDLVIPLLVLKNNT